MTILSTNLSVASMEYPLVSQYYKTKFSDTRDALQAQLLMSNATNPVRPVRMNTIKMNNLTVPDSVMSEVCHFDTKISCSNVVTLQHDQSYPDFESFSIDTLKSRSGNDIYIHIPTWTTDFVDYWFTTLKNSNLTIWTALPISVNIDDYSRYEFDIVDSVDMDVMNSFSRVCSDSTGSVKYRLYQIRFSLTVDSISHAFCLHFEIPSTRILLFDSLYTYILKMSSGRYGKILFHIISRVARITNTYTMLRSAIVSFLMDLQISPSVPLDQQNLSLFGLCEFIKLISVGEFGLPPYSLVVFFMKRYFNQSSLDRDINYDLCVSCFFAAYDKSSELNLYPCYSKSGFAQQILVTYRYDLVQSLSIFSNISTTDWADRYSGEGFESILLAMYVARFDFMEHESSSYGLALSSILKTTTLYCSNPEETKRLMDPASFRNKECSSVDTKFLFINDNKGQLCAVHSDGHTRARVSKYCIIDDPTNDSFIDMNSILPAIIFDGLGLILDATIHLPLDTRLCNSILNTGFTVDNFSSAISENLRSIHRLATYFAYFPNRTFDREVMYFGRKLAYSGENSFVINFRSKFTSSVCVFSKDRVNMTISSPCGTKHDVIGWYEGYKFHEYSDGEIVSYPAKYFRTPLHIEEYVQHKGYGYASPIGDLNSCAHGVVSCVNQILMCKNDKGLGEKKCDFINRQFVEFNRVSFFSGPLYSESLVVNDDHIYKVRLEILQSLPFRHVLTSVINSFYRGTPHILYVRPLALMAVQTAASSKIMTAAGANFNIHHSYVTEAATAVEYVCRVCGNVGTTQYIVRICEFINSMGISAIQLNHRYAACYSSEYLDYYNYTNGSNGRKPIKSLKALRGPTELKRHEVWCDCPSYTTTCELDTLHGTTTTSLPSSRFTGILVQRDLSSLSSLDLPKPSVCDYFDVLTEFKYPYEAPMPEVD